MTRDEPAAMLLRMNSNATETPMTTMTIELPLAAWQAPFAAKRNGKHATAAPAGANFALQVQALRPQLLRAARAHLRNPAWAEDVVSDTVLAALERPQSFAGRSQLKTWLIGILKHKVVDLLRRHAREVASSGEQPGELEVAPFAADGHFCTEPGDWGDPEASFSQAQFFAVLERCIGELPENLATVFMMRESLELDADEICRILEITPSNLWVMMHRARLRLRQALQKQWFDGRGG